MGYFVLPSPRGQMSPVRRVSRQTLRCPNGWYQTDDPYATYAGISINSWYSRVYRFPKYEMRAGQPCIGVGSSRNRRTREQCVNYYPDPYFKFAKTKACMESWYNASIGYGGKIRTTKNNIFLNEPNLGTPRYNELKNRWRINNTTTMELWTIGLRYGGGRSGNTSKIVLVINNLRYEISWREFMDRIRGVLGETPVQIQAEGWQTYSNGLQSRQITNTFKLCSKCKPITRTYTIWKDSPKSSSKIQTTEDYGIDMSAPGRNAPTSGFKAKTRFLTRPGEIINWSVSMDILDSEFVKK